MSEAISDIAAGLAELTKHMAAFDEMHGDIEPVDGELEAPISVTTVLLQESAGLGFRPPGTWVSVRVAGEKETRLGVLLGDLLQSPMVAHSAKSGTLFVRITTNPAIWVPALTRVVWGCESWWAPIKSPEQLRAITDHDIENVWYVQALKSLSADDEKAGDE